MKRRIYKSQILHFKTRLTLKKLFLGRLAAAMLMTALSLLPLDVALGATINVPDDFLTLQQAVNHASPGDEIMLGNGTYGPANLDMMGIENVLGAGDITIRAVNPGMVSVNGGSAAAFSASSFLGDITIQGLYLDTSGQSVIEFDDIEGVVVIQDNVFVSGYMGNGLTMRLSGISMTTLELRDNTFNTPAENEEALLILLNDNPQFDLIVEGNTFTSLQDEAVEVDVSSSSSPRITARIAHNTFNPWAGTGEAFDINLGGSGSDGTVASLLIEDNTITGAEGDALFIYLEGANTIANIIIRDNSIDSPTNRGIFIGGRSTSTNIKASVLIDNNTVSSAGDSGIVVMPRSTTLPSSLDVVVTDNTVINPGDIGVYCLATTLDDNYTLNLDLRANYVSGNVPNDAYFIVQDNSSEVNLEQGASTSTNPTVVTQDNNSGSPVTVFGTVSVVGDAVHDDQIPASLGNFIWNDLNGNGIQDGEGGIQGVSVLLTGTQVVGGMVNLVTASDTDGIYLFPALLPGDYTLTLAVPVGLSYSPQFAGAPAIDSNFDPATGQATVSLQEDDLTVDAGLIISTCLGDFDKDYDVDGSDLAELVANPARLELSTFADDFGRKDCP